MSSDFQKKKYAHLFHVYDVNGNGVIDMDDFVAAADRLAELKGLDKSSDIYKTQRSINEQWWQMFQRQIDLNQDGHITEGEMISFWSMVVERVAQEKRAGKTNMRDQIAASGRATFAMLDTDQSGEITIDEYGIFLKSWGVETNIEAAFNRLDLNKDGVISLDEAVALVLQFYLGDDPSEPGTHLFGILPE